MHKFLGIDPPPAKKPKTTEERKEQMLAYDHNKRDRCFKNNWLTKFSWVRYEKDTNRMFCTICEKHDKEGKGAFVVGCRNFRLDSLLSHDKSEGHRKNIATQLAKSTPAGASQGDKSVLLMNKAAVDKLLILFRNAHYVAKTGKPYTDYVGLCKLDKAKDLFIGETYLTDKYCQKFVTAIAQCRREEQDEEVNAASFMSVISDGSTDTSSTEAEIVYIKISHECKVQTMFVGVKNVPKGDSFHISKAISKLLTERWGEKWKTKIVACGTDGAAVMTGIKAGVIQKLREETGRTFIRAIHCSAHRLELAYKDAAKEVKLSQKCDLLLLNLYLFYKYSPLNRSNLKTSFKSLGEEKTVLPTRVGGTRWLPHTQRAIKNLLTGIGAITNHLEQMQATPTEFRKESSAKARNFLKLLKDDAMIAWIHFTMDVVKCLSVVSTTIQNTESTLADIFNELESAKLILQKYEKSDGPYLRKVVVGKDKIANQKTKLISNLITYLTRRFESDVHLFKASSVLSIGKWPADLKKEIDFGDENITDLTKLAEPALKALRNDVDVEAIETEWTRLKCSVSNRKHERSSMTWQSLFLSDGDKCPNLFLLVDYMLTLPGSSVDAERGFSCMKMVKNDWRSRLGDSNLSDLMLISMEVADVETYDPLAAIEKWYSGGLRAKRPFYKDELIKNRVQTEKVFRNDQGQLEDVVNESNNGERETVENENEEVIDELNMLNADENEEVNINNDSKTGDKAEDDNEDDDDDEVYFKTNDLREMQLKSYRLLLEMI